MRLGSNQSLTEISTRDISWVVKATVRRTDKLTTFMLPIFLKSGSLNLLAPSGPVQACTGFALIFVIILFQKFTMVTTLTSVLPTN
jgi:hypothetical protein